MWIIIKFYNNIMKSANMDKGVGVKPLIHKIWIKIRVFLTPALANGPVYGPMSL